MTIPDRPWSPKLGTLYGIGVGPGDPEWITVKAARILGACRNVAAPRARIAAESVALDIVRTYLRSDVAICELVFPMTSDQAVLAASWREAAGAVYKILAGGEDCAFITLGDPLLYSTYISLMRAIGELDPAVPVVTVPGVTAFSAAAALASFPVGQGKQPVTIVPASDDLALLGEALDRGGTVVLMKVGRRLEAVLDVLASRDLLQSAVFVAHAGMANQQVETNLKRLRGLPEEAGYLSLMLIEAGTALEGSS